MAGRVSFRRVPPVLLERWNLNVTRPKASNRRPTAQYVVPETSRPTGG